MPIYTYLCRKCGKEKDQFRSLRARLLPAICGCGGVGTFILSTRSKLKNIYPFVDNYMDAKPVQIGSLKHYRQELSKRNLIETGRRKGMKGQWI